MVLVGWHMALCKQEDFVKWHFLLFLCYILIFRAQMCWFIEFGRGVLGTCKIRQAGSMTKVSFFPNLILDSIGVRLSHWCCVLAEQQFKWKKAIFMTCRPDCHFHILCLWKKIYQSQFLKSSSQPPWNFFLRKIHGFWVGNKINPLKCESVTWF